MTNRQNIILIILFVSATALCFASIYFLHPRVAGDSLSYIESIEFLGTGEAPQGFVPNRLLTTFGGLQLISMFSGIFGSVLGVWLSMNIIFYFLLAFAFYRMLFLAFESEKTALFSALFLAGNYSLLTFGLAYLMDIGGWAFYMFSILFSLRYIKFKGRRDIVWASVCVGVGALFKEYALLGAIPIAVILIYENYRLPTTLFKKSILPAVIAILPVAIVYWYAYSNFGYTYLNWLEANQAYYVYPSRIAEYVKSFGSLINILGIVFAGGLWVIYKEWRQIEKSIKLFIFSVLASFLPIFFWPAITQRILFITVPFIIFVSGFIFKKYEKYWYAFLPVLAIYIVASLLMDSFLLNYISLPF